VVFDQHGVERDVQPGAVADVVEHVLKVKTKLG